MFTTLISDFGSVLTYQQDDNWVQEMIRLIKAPAEITLFKKYYTDFRNEYDAGLLDCSDYWQKVASALHCPPLRPEQITTLVEYDIKSWFNINLEMLEFIKSLKPCFKRLVLLSNINFECAAYLEKTCAWLDLFDIKVMSCYEKVAKPNKTIYKITLSRATTDPGDCIFIDDNPDNVRSSRELGITTLLFTNVQDIKTQYESLRATSNSSPSTKK